MTNLKSDISMVSILDEYFERIEGNDLIGWVSNKNADFEPPLVYINNKLATPDAINYNYIESEKK